MGTRNLTCVFIDNDFKVAQYGQWDGYPSGQGATLLELLAKLDLDTLKKNVRASRWATDEEVEAAWAEAGADPSAEFVPMEVADKLAKNHPEWHRDTAAEIVEMLGEGPLALRNNLWFATDGVFCEWAYVVDLDAMTLEVYAGCNKTPGKDHGKFASLPRVEGTNPKYSTVVLLKTYPISQLPSVEQLVADCTKKEEE